MNDELTLRHCFIAAVCILILAVLVFHYGVRPIHLEAVYGEKTACVQTRTEPYKQLVFIGKLMVWKDSTRTVCSEYRVVATAVPWEERQ